MGLASSRDAGEIKYKHLIEFIDKRVETCIPGYEDDQRARGYVAKAAYVELTLGKQCTYRGLVSALLAAYGIAVDEVQIVRIDYKASVGSKANITISENTPLEEIIKNQSIVLILYVITWNNKSSKLAMPADGRLLPQLETTRQLPQTLQQPSETNPAFVSDEVE